MHYFGIYFGWYRDTFKFQGFTYEFDSIITGLSLEWKSSIFQIGIVGVVNFLYLVNIVYERIIRIR